LHGTATGDPVQEREADMFAAELLTPRNSILPNLPRRVDLRRLADLSRVWGVSVHSLLYRCRETGLLSDTAASRGYQRLRGLQEQPGFAPRSIADFPTEQPSPVQRKGTARALGARHRVEQVLLDYDVDHLPLAPEADVTAYLVGLGTAGELVLHREQAHQFDLQEITEITKGAATDARAHTAPLRGGTRLRLRQRNSAVKILQSIPWSAILKRPCRARWLTARGGRGS
jgi:hypothetical protein